jgi:hypothetical protein
MTTDLNALSAVSSSYYIMSNGRMVNELERMLKEVLSEYLFEGTGEIHGLIRLVGVLAEILSGYL